MTRSAIFGMFLGLLVSSAALAGPRSDGGGKGVLCTTASGRTLEALDIYEAKNVYRFGEAPRKTTLVTEFAFGVGRFEEATLDPNKQLPSGTEQQWEELYKKSFAEKVIEIPAGTRLPITDDATLPVLPLGCESVQVAVFNTLGVQLDKEYWNLMDSRNQAAIVVHEMLYPYRKKYGATTSDETRRFVGQLFSLTPPAQRFLGVPKTGYLECRAGNSKTPAYDFVVYPTTEAGNDVTVISFRQIDDATLLGRLTATIAGREIYQSILSAEETGMNNELKSESHDETRSLNLETKAGSSGIEIKVSTRDNYTGKISTESSGLCWVK